MTGDYIAHEEARLRGVEANTWPPLRIAGFSGSTGPTNSARSPVSRGSMLSGCLGLALSVASVAFALFHYGFSFSAPVLCQ